MLSIFCIEVCSSGMWNNSCSIAERTRSYNSSQLWLMDTVAGTTKHFISYNIFLFSMKLVQWSMSNVAAQTKFPSACIYMIYCAPSNLVHDHARQWYTVTLLDLSELKQLHISVFSAMLYPSLTPLSYLKPHKVNYVFLAPYLVNFFAQGCTLTRLRLSK